MPARYCIEHKSYEDVQDASKCLWAVQHIHPGRCSFITQYTLDDYDPALD